MKIYKEINSLLEFEPWCGAKSTWKKLVDHDCAERAIEILEESYPEGLSETAFNDILWFEFEWLYKMLGLPTDEQEEALKIVSSWEQSNPDFVEYISTIYGLDPNDFNNAEDFVDFLKDEQIFEEFVDFCEEKKEK